MWPPRTGARQADIWNRTPSNRLPAGSVMPSPVETNVTQPDAVRSALRKVFSRVPDARRAVALLIPDPVVRVFILPFETLPRRADEALPLLALALEKKRAVRRG